MLDGKRNLGWGWAAAAWCVLGCSPAPEPQPPSPNPNGTGVASAPAASASATPSGEMLSPEQLAKLEKECAEPQAFSCKELGDRFRDGRGVPKDEKRALQYFSKCCEQLTMPFTCEDLAKLLIAGHAGKPDFARIFKAHDAACAPGMDDACHTLGDKWRDGDGVPKDAAKANQLYQKGCEHHKAAKKACAAGDETACEMAGTDESCKRLGK